MRSSAVMRGAGASAVRVASVAWKQTPDEHTKRGQVAAGALYTVPRARGAIVLSTRAQGPPACGSWTRRPNTCRRLSTFRQRAVPGALGAREAWAAPLFEGVRKLVLGSVADLRPPDAIMIDEAAY